ncbi:uncharacterized protein BDFB_011394, partial [Asbolus verrucosus]
MDFLEMDFDPGPSGDADSDSISNAEIDNAASLPLDSKAEVVEEPKPCCSKDLNNEVQPETSNIYKYENTVKSKYLNFARVIPEPVKDIVNTSRVEIKMPWSCSLSERTRTAKSLRMIKRHHSSRGELSSPNEIVLNGDINITNLTSFHNATGKILIDDKNSVDSDIEKNMIWTSHEACLKQITQVGPSACGATSVLNVLNALRFPIPTLEKVQECVNTKLRANSSPLTEYLLSRKSVLLVRTEDVISRWNRKIDLPQLMRINDVRWKELNVVGQVAKVVRESRREARVDYVFTSHIKIPAEYKAGITLVLDINSPAFTLLRQCPELPLLQPEYAASAL